MYNSFIKRTIDFVIALLGLLVLSPLLFLVTLGLAFLNKGKPFFFQIRPGLNEQLFKIIKFKTMTNKCDEHGDLLPDAYRITAVGSFVRKTSLDELPQLMNVLIGDMSLIGPRPLLLEYLSLYNEEQKKRHLVKPGITGWAQVNGRNSISWHDKFKFDVFYAENISLKFDLKILFLTMKKVIVREGISSVTSVTMEKFKGN